VDSLRPRPTLVYEKAGRFFVRHPVSEKNKVHGEKCLLQPHDPPQISYELGVDDTGLRGQVALPNLLSRILSSNGALS